MVYTSILLNLVQIGLLVVVLDPPYPPALTPPPLPNSAKTSAHTLFQPHFHHLLLLNLDHDDDHDPIPSRSSCGSTHERPGQ
jgi:hypothetical protein